jgi:hypothetical protein
MGRALREAVESERGSYAEGSEGKELAATARTLEADSGK